MIMRFLRRTIVRVLARLGVDCRSAETIVADLGEHKGRLAAAVGGTVLAPAAEIAFITVLYAIVDPAQRLALLTRARGTAPWLDGLSAPAVGVLFAGGALVFLVIAIAAKYFSGIAQARFMLSTFVTQSRRIVQAYLYATPRRAVGLDRAAVASASMTESGKYGRVVYTLLDALANVLAAVLFLLTAIAISPILVLVAAALAAVTVKVTARGFREQSTT
ncbi:MAG: hypothetical protein M3R55_07775, partial [Acidobacteriota bacterium]|nr:hypothetical protein [Acidobacteriota bacterium]